jgi:uncharacterized glyoxalase superfamily protein PhnB
MRYQELKPMLRTWDLPGTVAFYTDVLGFQCIGQSDEYGWAHLQRDGVAIMLSGPNQHEGDTAPAFTGSLYITCDAVDELWEILKDRVKVCYPVETFDYGMREFGIYDNNGYLLQFGEPC